MKPVHLTRRTFVISSLAASAQLVAFGQPSSKPRVGCQTNGWVVPGDSFEGLLSVLKQAKITGYDGFECNVRFVRSEFPNAGEARKKINDTGMFFIGVHSSYSDDIKPDFDKVARGAARMGAHHVVMSDKGLAPDGKFTPEALHAKVAQLEAVGKVCNDNGIRLAYHNHRDEFANGNAEINGLAANSNPELLHFLIDAGHAYQGGGDPAAFMRQYSQRGVGCHLKTFAADNVTQVPLGQGRFGFEALAAAVRETRWTGWLMDEEGGGAKIGGPGAVAADREYLRKIFGV